MNTETELILNPECYKRHAAIESHIKEGEGWRAAIITLVIAVIIQVAGFLTMWGSVTKMVEINTKRIDRIEDLHFKAPLLEK